MPDEHAFADTVARAISRAIEVFTVPGHPHPPPVFESCCRQVTMRADQFLAALWDPSLFTPKQIAALAKLLELDPGGLIRLREPATGRRRKVDQVECLWCQELEGRGGMGPARYTQDEHPHCDLCTILAGDGHQVALAELVERFGYVLCAECDRDNPVNSAQEVEALLAADRAKRLED